MNPRITSLLCGLLLTITAQAALAQPSTVIENATAAAGQTSVNVNVTFTPAAGNTNAAQFDINFNKTALSADIAAVCPALWVCSQTAGGIRLVSPFASGGSLAGINIEVPFNLTLASSNTTYPLTLAGELYANAANQPLLASGSSNGSIEILPPPAPAFSSNPTPAAGVTVPSVIQNATDTTANVVISNSGGGGSTLTGSCTETADPSNVFSLSGDTNFSVLQGTTDTVTVICDSAGPIANHTGQMSCSHNGASGLSSPQVYALSCAITAGPQPAYTSSNPTAGGTITLPDTEAGDPNPSQSLTITNSGAANTTLSGTCSLLAGDPQITLTAGGAFNIPQGSVGTGSVQTVSCNASVQGNYSRTLSCSHNGSSPASPVNYPVSCNVTEAGAAVFASNPVPGPIDVDNGSDVVVGDPAPTRVLTLFNNADSGDQSLDINCALSGSAFITVQPDISGGILIAPGSSSQVTFSCATGNAGDRTATYSCNYQNGGVDQPAGDPAPNAVYNLSCEVREPEAEVEITPTPGAPQTQSVPPGGSTSFDFDFTEINDEGVDGSLVGCELGTGGQGFTISTPTFPTDILSGETVTVVVGFTDPIGQDSYSDTLTCTFGDSNDDDTEVSWPLTVNIGGNATFTVLKDFTDGNPGNVTVDLDCNTGLILDQQKTISEDGIGVTFVVTDFDAGELDCNVTERPVAGYSTEYAAGGDSNNASVNAPDDDPGCYFSEVAGGDENLCEITNSPLPVDVVITKEWVYPGSADASGVDDYFELQMYCDNAIIEGGYECAINAAQDGAQSVYQTQSCKFLSGNGNTVFTESVDPFSYPGGTCWVIETSHDQAVEVDNGCSNLEVSAGSGDSCTITNTVFFEGIPTLNQYGMALMALLMLGMGFVAVRRVI